MTDRLSSGKGLRDPTSWLFGDRPRDAARAWGLGVPISSAHTGLVLGDGGAVYLVAEGVTARSSSKPMDEHAGGLGDVVWRREVVHNPGGCESL